jgi:hypothetical protein
MSKITDAEFIAAWNQFHSPQKVANFLGITLRWAHKKRAELVSKGESLPTISASPHHKTYFTPDTAAAMRWEKRRQLKVKNGYVVIFSDPHFYPDHNAVAQDALIKVIKQLKPQAVLCGGDALDGTQIGRHDPTRGWHQPISLREQLECVCESMTAIKKAAKGATTMMTLGNHDARLSRFLAMRAPEVEGLPGTKLEDYIPSWPLSWTIEINGDTILRHRHLGGALAQQAQKAGCNFVHGHLHKLGCMVTPQYHGFKYSVDAGSLADPKSDAFDYAEDGVPFVQGFAVLKFENHKMLWPEFCYVQNGAAYFRGEKL